MIRFYYNDFHVNACVKNISMARVYVLFEY